MTLDLTNCNWNKNMNAPKSSSIGLRNIKGGDFNSGIWQVHVLSVQCSSYDTDSLWKISCLTSGSQKYGTMSFVKNILTIVGWWAMWSQSLQTSHSGHAHPWVNHIIRTVPNSGRVRLLQKEESLGKTLTLSFSAGRTHPWHMKEWRRNTTPRGLEPMHAPRSCLDCDCH